MKKITIAHIGSNEWFNYKEEIIFGLYHALRSLGYEVQIKHNQLDEQSINFIIGGDWLSQDVKFQQFIDNKLKYYIFEVENFDGVTINSREGFNLKNYCQMVEKSLGVITPYLYNIDTINKLDIIDKDKIQYLKWGFFEEVIDPNIVRTQARNIHGTFFGLLKGDRLAKAQMLQSKLQNQVRFLGREQPHAYKAAALSSSHYALSLAYGESEKFVNPFRLYYLFSNGVNAISDNTIDADGYLQLAIKAPIANFVDQMLRQVPDESELIERAKMNNLKHNIKAINI